MWPVVSPNDVRVLARNVEITIRAEGDVEGMCQSWVRRLVLREDLPKIVSASGIPLATKSEDLALSLPGIRDVEITIRAERESTQLAQGNSVRQVVRLQHLAEVLAFLGERVDVVPLSRVVPAVKRAVPDCHANLRSRTHLLPKIPLGGELGAGQHRVGFRDCLIEELDVRRRQAVEHPRESHPVRKAR